jgi:hypothetical protein
MSAARSVATAWMIVGCIASSSVAPLMSLSKNETTPRRLTHRSRRGEFGPPQDSLVISWSGWLGSA